MGMATIDVLRDGVRRSLSPEIDRISDGELARQVIETYALALSETQFSSLEEMTCSGMIGGKHIPGLTQADHIRGVARLARNIVDDVRSLYGRELELDPDIVAAAGLLHDVGKPYFYDHGNIETWRENKRYTGRPPFRHTLYGAHLALQVGLPTEIVHVIAGHDIRMDGQFVEPSVYLRIVAMADDLYWIIPGRFDLFEPEPTPVEGPGA